MGLTISALQSEWNTIILIYIKGYLECTTNLKIPSPKPEIWLRLKRNLYPHTRAVLYNTKSISLKEVSEF